MTSHARHEVRFRPALFLPLAGEGRGGGMLGISAAMLRVASSVRLPCSRSRERIRDGAAACFQCDESWSPKTKLAPTLRRRQGLKKKPAPTLCRRQGLKKKPAPILCRRQGLKKKPAPTLCRRRPELSLGGRELRVLPEQGEDGARALVRDGERLNAELLLGLQSLELSALRREVGVDEVTHAVGQSVGQSLDEV
jgi:hypothetical protein